MKVLVITARGLQAGALSCYGNGWIDTPTLDSLAASGIVFDCHFADAADAAGARRAWRSGNLSVPASRESHSVRDDQGTDAVQSLDLLSTLHAKKVFTFL